jgi:hypothetical protein
MKSAQDSATLLRSVLEPMEQELAMLRRQAGTGEAHRLREALDKAKRMHEDMEQEVGHACHGYKGALYMRVCIYIYIYIYILYIYIYVCVSV